MIKRTVEPYLQGVHFSYVVVVLPNHSCDDVLDSQLHVGLLLQSFYATVD